MWRIIDENLHGRDDSFGLAITCRYSIRKFTISMDWRSTLVGSFVAFGMTWCVVRRAATSHSSIEPELLAARKAISREIRLPSGPLGSADLLHRRRYPCAFAGWQDREWTCPWPVEAHHRR